MKVVIGLLFYVKKCISLRSAVVRCPPGEPRDMGVNLPRENFFFLIVSFHGNYDMTIFFLTMDKRKKNLYFYKHL